MTSRTRPATARGTPRRATPAQALLAGGVLAQVVYPLTDGAARDAVAAVAVGLLAAACVAHAARTRGITRAGLLVAATAGVGLVAELVGTRTGVPFGSYAYAPGRLGPTVAGVPLVVAAAWTTGAWPAWCVARRLVRGAPARVAVGAWALVSWDLYLDPQMVADGRWSFAAAGPTLPGVSGVPLSNLLGWVVVSVVMVSLVARLDRDGPRRGPRPGTEDLVPIALWLWTWLGSAAAHLVLLGLPASGLWGLVGLGVVGVPLLVRLHRRTARW